MPKRSTKRTAIKTVIKGVHGERPAFVVDPETGCWLCTGASQGDGYAMINSEPAHRYAYKAANGEITTGHQVHHLCDNRHCIYPAHLVAVSRADHNRIHRYERQQLQ